MILKKVVHHKANKGHYVADAVVFWCFDTRFFQMFKKFKRSHKYRKVDLAQSTGGAKGLSSPSHGETSYLLFQIEASHALHHVKRVVLMVHLDCGAYKGHSKFKGRKLDEEFYTSELKKAKKIVTIFLKRKKINIPVDTYYADYTGLHKVII